MSCLSSSSFSSHIISQFYRHYSIMGSGASSRCSSTMTRSPSAASMSLQNIRQGHESSAAESEEYTRVLPTFESFHKDINDGYSSPSGRISRLPSYISDEISRVVVHQSLNYTPTETSSYTSEYGLEYCKSPSIIVFPSASGSPTCTSMSSLRDADIVACESLDSIMETKIRWEATIEFIREFSKLKDKSELNSISEQECYELNESLDSHDDRTFVPSTSSQPVPRGPKRRKSHRIESTASE